MTALKIVGLAFAAVLWLAFARPAKAKEHGFVDRTYKDAENKETKYVLFVPHDFQGRHQEFSQRRATGRLQHNTAPEPLPSSICQIH